MKAGSRPRAEPRLRLARQITACWTTQALHVAVQLDLPDRLVAGPQAAAALAEACTCSADGLRRLLRALCALQVCRERRDGRFELTAAGAALCRQPPDGSASLRGLVLWWGGPLWQLWGELGYSVQTGQSARARQTGAAHYDFLDGRPEAAAVFHDAMQAMTALIADDVAQLPTWAGVRSLVDLGGGNGTLAAAIAAAQPQLQFTVLDRADAEAGALAVLGTPALVGRGQFVCGDFFAPLPPLADRYLLKSILHNWDDAACRRILARCAEAAGPGARLLLVERVSPARLRPGHRDEALARTDLNMLAGLGGRERTLAEFEALLRPAGFEVVGLSPTRHEFSVIEARRAQGVAPARPR
ncbi:methyltransferase [Rubrivivax sp. A210]|uniref:methyltransferase n=1 Tax=Rubrivivax sp. A210 TaxID=2772301 RepID=UPI001917BA75|nr:methyltransferase [Rubrivivax sp. A210]